MTLSYSGVYIRIGVISNCSLFFILNIMDLYTPT
jgi:hypothetical protein